MIVAKSSPNCTKPFVQATPAVGSHPYHPASIIRIHFCFSSKKDKNEISAKSLNDDALSWIEMLRQVLFVKDKGKGTVKGYAAEMILLFKYLSHKTVAAITQSDIEAYIVFMNTVHKVGRAKCRREPLPHNWTPKTSA